MSGDKTLTEERLHAALKQLFCAHTIDRSRYICR